MLRGTFRTFLFTCLIAVVLPAVPALAEPVPAPTPSPETRTDPLPDSLRRFLATPEGKPDGLAAGWVIGGDQGHDRVWVLNAASGAWAPEGAATRWSWAPTAENGFADVLAGWGLVSDVRARRAGTSTLVLATDSFGFIGAVEFPSGERRWATNAGAPSNVHAAELLPDGNIAAAASTGGWVRIYTASQGPASGGFTEFRLKGGHGVLWDPAHETLWAVGDDHLVEFEIGGTPPAPTLNPLRQLALPTQGGHDLAPVYADRDRLWITTNHAVYQFDKTSGTFHTDYRFATGVNLPIVKAVGDNPATGQVMLTRPTAGCATTWCTDTAEFFGRTAWNATRTLDEAQFYKARWFVPAYQ